MQGNYLAYNITNNLEIYKAGFGQAGQYYMSTLLKYIRK